MDIYDADIDYQKHHPYEQVDRRGIIELVHDGYLGRGYRTMHEAWANVRKTGARHVVFGQDGKWYCLAAANARKYNEAVDKRKGN